MKIKKNTFENLDIKLIVYKISKGDRAAFQALFNIYYQRLLHIGIYYLKSKEWAEEAVSDVFCTIWNKRRGLGAIDNIEKYLYTSVKNQALHYIRRASPVESEYYSLYQIEWIPDLNNPEEILLEQEYRELIGQAILSLPEKCREVFRLSFSDRLKHRQITELLDISEKMVEAHIAKAYKRIAEYVNKRL